MHRETPCRTGSVCHRTILLWNCAWALLSCTAVQKTVPADSLPLGVIPSTRMATPLAQTSSPALLDAAIADVPQAKATWLRPTRGGPATYVVEAGPLDPALPPLVLVHGLGTNGVKDFYGVLSALSQNRRVILVDLPGLGRSELGSDAPSPDVFSTRLGDVVASISEGPVDLLGHSLGAVVTMIYAARQPQRVHNLILVDAAGILHREAFVTNMARGALDPVTDRFQTVGAWLEGRTAVAVATLRAMEPSDSVMANSGFVWSDAQKRAAMELINLNVAEVLHQIRAPTLILWGTLDDVAPLRTAQVLLDRLPQARLVTFEGAGHVPMTNNPDRFASEVLEYLDQPSSPEPAVPHVAAPRDFTCTENDHLLLEGVFRHLILRHCRGELRNVTAERLTLEHSLVQLTQVHITGGVKAVESTLIAQGGTFAGEVAMILDGSRADLAGSIIQGQRWAFQALRPSRVLFSVTTVNGRKVHQAVHGHLRLAKGQQL